MSFFSKKKKKSTPQPAAATKNNIQTQQATCTSTIPTYSTGRGGLTPVTFPSDTVEDNNKKLVAVVLTIFQSSSYDSLFREKKQDSGEGTRTQVYQTNYSELEYIHQLLEKKEVPEAITDKNDQRIYKDLLKDIQSIPEDACVFNFECCSHCGELGFSEHTPIVIDFIAMAIQAGHMVMNSDFSLKALIACWSQFSDYMGPNPFIKYGGFSGSFTLHFDPSILSECPSSQLVKVGELCEKGTVTVKAAPDTILYTIDPTKTDHSNYILEVLSVVDKPEPLRDNNCKSKYTVDEPQPIDSYVCKVGVKEGSAGHVLLTFPSGGLLLTSCGHWIALVDLDVSEETLISVASAHYGKEKSAAIQRELDSISCPTAKSSRVKEYSRDFVQTSCASNYQQKSKSRNFNGKQ